MVNALFRPRLRGTTPPRISNVREVAVPLLHSDRQARHNAQTATATTAVGCRAEEEDASEIGAFSLTCVYGKKYPRIALSFSVAHPVDGPDHR